MWCKTNNKNCTRNARKEKKRIKNKRRVTYTGYKFLQVTLTIFVIKDWMITYPARTVKRSVLTFLHRLVWDLTSICLCFIEIICYNICSNIFCGIAINLSSRLCSITMLLQNLFMGNTQQPVSFQNEQEREARESIFSL